MQTTIDFDNLFDIPAKAVPLIWLKNHRWNALFAWNLDSQDRKLERSRRIVRKLFPDGISQADFMKVRLK